MSCRHFWPVYFMHGCGSLPDEESPWDGKEVVTSWLGVGPGEDGLPLHASCCRPDSRRRRRALARVTENPGVRHRMRGYGAPNRRLADASLAPCNQPLSVPGAFGGGIHCLCPGAELEASFPLEKAHRVGIGAVNGNRKRHSGMAKSPIRKSGQLASTRQASTSTCHSSSSGPHPNDAA